MASKSTPAPKKTAAKKKETPAASAPVAAAGDPAASIPAQTAAATLATNPASTTSAADPNRDPTNDAVGTVQKALERGEGGTGEYSGEKEPTRGEVHSHPAETTAERNLRLSGFSGQIIEPPAGEDADPANNPSPTEESLEDKGSIHDESGVIQDATREAIGAGYGAPDGIFSQAVDAAADDDSDADDVEPVTFENGRTIRGNKARIWHMVEKGATRQELDDATGNVNALGLAYSLAADAGRKLVIQDGSETSNRTYKLETPKEAKSED